MNLYYVLGAKMKYSQVLIILACWAIIDHPPTTDLSYLVYIITNIYVVPLFISEIKYYPISYILSSATPT